MLQHTSSEVTVTETTIKFKHEDLYQTRRLAACTQAVVIMRSTSFIAIELKCSAFEIVRNSIESMC